MTFAFGRKFIALSAIFGAALAAHVIVPAPASAQFSAGYNFLKGVRDGDFAAVRAEVDQPGSIVVNHRDPQTGEGALHIVTRRRDTQWLLYLLRARANPNLRDREGNTAMHIAAQIGFGDAIRWLDVVDADVNATNNRGETPLILAVQSRNADIVRQLVEAGANPDIADGMVGMSARDYAARDSRSRTILQILDSAETQTESTQSIGPVLD